MTIVRSIAKRTEAEELGVDLVRFNGYVVESKRLADALVITDDVEDELATDCLSKVKTAMREAEEDRKDKKSPFLEMGRRIDALYKPIVEGLSEAESIIKGKMKDFRMEKERLRQAEEKRRQAEFSKKLKEERRLAEKEGREVEIIAAPAPLLQDTQTRGDIGLSSSSEFVNYEVADILAFANAHPDLVKIEVKRKETLAFVAMVCKREFSVNAVKGLKLFKDMKIISR